MKIKALKNTKFYSSYDADENFLVDVIKYANGDGGTIYFGVQPDGEVKGLPIYAHTLAEIDEIINARIRPKVATDIFKQRFENKDILAVRVNSFSTDKMNRDKPRFSMVDDLPDLPKLDLQEELPPEPEVLDKDRFMYSPRVAWFLAVTGRIPDPLSLTRRQSEIYLSESGLLNKMELNIPGALLFGTNDLLARLYPYAYTMVMVTGKIRNHEQLKWQFRNNLFYQIESSADLLIHQINMRIRKIQMDSGRVVDFPVHIIQPLITMAVVWRDYSLNVPLEVDLRGRSLTLVVPGMKAENLLMGYLPADMQSQSYSQIISVMKQIGYLNDHCNFRKLNEILAARNIRPLDYRTVKNGLEINLDIKEMRQVDPVRRRDRDVGERKREMLHVIQQKNDITLEEIAEKLNISKATAKLYSLQLQEDGLLTRTGSRRKGRWVITE